MDHDQLVRGAQIAATSAIETEVREKLMVGLIAKLGILPDDWVPEEQIPKSTFGKGDLKRTDWKPDYMFRLFGLRVGVIEVKNSTVPVEEAWREAQMYANEINRNHSDISAIHMVMACNGKDILVGHTHTKDKDAVRLNVLEMLDKKYDFARLEHFAGRAALNRHAEDVRANRRLGEAHSIRQRRYGGGEPEEDIGNEFFPALKPLLREGFVDLSQLDDEAFEAAYCAESRVMKDRKHENVLRDRRPAGSDAKNITSKNVGEALNSTLLEFADSLIHRSAKPIQMAVLLGGSGVGKTTLLDWYRRFELPRQKVVSVFVDGRDLPQQPEALYSRIIELTVAKTQEVIRETMYGGDNAKQLRNTLRSEWEEEHRSLYPKMEQDEYLDTKFPELARSIRSTPHKYLKLLVTHLASKGIPVALVLDNLDTADLGEQVTGFTVLRPFGGEFKVFTVMTLREETWLKYRHQKPFNAYHDVEYFHVPGVSIADVVEARVGHLDTRYGDDRKTTAIIPWDGKKLEVSKSAAVRILNGFSTALHTGDTMSPLDGVCGTDLRRGLDSFRDMCRSSKFATKTFLPPVLSDQPFVTDRTTVLKSVMCGRRAYYYQGDGIVANVFQPTAGEKSYSHFVVLHILRFLLSHSEDTPNAGKGYCAVGTILDYIRSWCPMDESTIRSVLLRMNVTGIWQVDTIVPKLSTDFSAVRLQHQGLYLIEGIYRDDAYLDMVGFDTPIGDKLVREELYELSRLGLPLSSKLREYLSQAERIEYASAKTRGFKFSAKNTPFMNDMDHIDQ